MVTRRTFIKSLVTLPPMLAIDSGWAASADPSRLALVIGNSAYRHTPLANPANDARAMSDLFGMAGFTVDTCLDTTHTDLTSAIERFGDAVQRAETRLAVFYYAGHGAQLDWRNYLLPVDAEVSTAEQLKQRCVDLGLLLGKLGAARDKTFVIILDACRNNPFGDSYRPEQKGLSQFDAPVGSLLAYATSPGNIASDGSGKHGLYTENLVRELSVRGTRIEDGLKRVRLNVRLQSLGKQIPWETTSLESDVYLFNDGHKKLSDAELEKQLEEDLAEWTRIKASRNPEDWVAYLRKLPNGRFAEIAQTRLTHLLAEAEKPRDSSAATIVQSPAVVPETETAPIIQASTPQPGSPVIELNPGAVTPLVKPSANPYSAGRYPLGRKFTVGDKATFRVSDLLTGIEMKTVKITITRVDADADRVEGNNGKWVYDLMGNELSNPNWATRNIPAQMVPFELQVGKKWTAAWSQKHTEKGEQIVTMEMRIAAFEKIRTELGEFNAFRIEGRGWAGGNKQNMELERRLWVVPGINFFIRVERINRNNKGRLVRTERVDLVYLRQQNIGRSFSSI
ncbi:MAG: caspase family protein [Sulfuricellaceae bacterium]|nr:caspase family protein [Sulfuricellaceae bacterium]